MRIEKQFVKVINQDGSLAVADYFESAEIETEQTLESGDLDSISTTGLLPLPDEGEEVLQQLYAYDNKVVYCRQKHNRTIYPPEQTPALFSFFRGEFDAEGNPYEWIQNEKVELGWKRIYNDVTYEVSQPHQTAIGQEPDIAPAIWNVWTDPNLILVWVQPLSTNPYMLGDKVTHNGFTWESTINNNVWAPGIYGWVKI